MAANDYLDFNFDDFPEAFQHDIDGVTYNFVIYYNDFNDSFYIDLYDNNEPPVPIVLGEKLVYGMPLWGTITDPRLPAIQLVPIDDDDKETVVDSSNFPGIVKLEFIDTEIDEDASEDDTDSNADANSPMYAYSLDDDGNLYGEDVTRGGQ